MAGALPSLGAICRKTSMPPTSPLMPSTSWVCPRPGTGLIPPDAIDGQDPQPVVVLGYKFWQRHFRALDPNVVGKTIN